MAIRIAAVNSATMSDDRKEFVVHTTGKYTGALELRFTSDCVDDLIAALTSARGDKQPAAPHAAQPAAAPAVVRHPNGAEAAAPAVPSKDNPDEVKFEIPKNCTITADNTGLGLVLFILNHRLERQAGYAFSPDAAKQLAGGLAKSADAVLAQRPISKS